MSAQRFSTGRQFVWNGQRYEIRRLLADNKMNITDLRTAESRVVSYIELYQALLAEELQFVLEAQPDNPVPQMGSPELSD
jgi:hypothetical protein